VTLLDDARDRVDDAELAKERAARESIARRARTLEASLRILSAERDSLKQQLDFTLGVSGAKLKAPKWTRKPSKRSGVGVALALLTDTHFDEIVNPAEIDGLNAYNRQIAEKRLRKWAENVCVLAREYVTGIAYDGLVVPMAGDIFSGTIHEELKETNEATLMASVVHWIEHLEAALRLLADEFGSVHCPAVVGNHGRFTRKPVAKRRAQDNVEWLLYRMLERAFRDDPRVTFAVSDAADAMFSVHGTNYLLTHGDQFRGGSGIAGMFSPLMLGHHRKTRRQVAAGKPFDWLVMGHMHQLFMGKGIIVGGTLKGSDEFSYVSNFAPEPPQQAFWINDPEHGPTINAPVHVMDRKAEGW
jgi:hypothetical protein